MMSSPTSEILCTKCHKNFPSLCNLHHHEKLKPSICKIEVNDSENKILCSQCGKAFCSTSSLNKHIRNIHRIEYYSRQLITEKGANEILCSHCSKTFSTISAVNLHIRKVHKIEHYSRQLTTEKAVNKILCSHCGKAFSCISSLNKHIRDVHKIKYYSRQFTTEKDANKIPCSHCSKTFSSISAVNLHIRNIHKIEHYSRQLTTEKAANKILCSQCGKPFSCISSLNKHIRNIHKIKYYSRQSTTEKAADEILCSHCSKTFSHISSLNKHIRNIHKIEYYSRTSTKAADDQIKRTCINCKECNKTFSSLYSLLRHQEKFHGLKRLKRKRQKKPQEPLTNENDIINNLPANFHYTVHPVQPGSKCQFIKVDFPIMQINDLQTWLTQYCECNKIFLKKYTCKSKNDSIVYKKYFGCGHKVKIRPNCRTRANSLEKNTNCPFRIMLSALKRANDRLLARVQISSHHNHAIGCASSVKFRNVSDKVREKMLYLFSCGYTPVKALRAHSDDLKEEYGDEYYKIQVDRYYMPEIQWVYYLHRKEYKDDFGLQYAAKMLKALKEKVADNENVRLKIMDDSNNFILSIVTPFMLRIHEEILQSKEMVFIDSTGTMDMLGCKVFVIFTNSFSGGLPLGVIITTTVTTEAISDGLKMVQELISEKSFGGRGKKGPILFITDDSQSEFDALHNVFPDALLLLRQCHILEAMWRYIWSNSAGIRIVDRTTVFLMFKSLIHECDEILFEEKASHILQNEIVLRYPIFQKHLQDVLNLRKDWASSFRKDLITRENTNYLCEASMRIIKEVILNQCRAYSPFELLKIITSEFQNYYIDKLRSIANRHTPDYLHSKFDKLSKKISNTLIFDKATSKVISKYKEYFIDFDIGLCSCIEDTGGKLCKHLILALKDCGVESYLTFPKTEEELKSIFYITEGRHVDEIDNWFGPLGALPTNDYNIEVTNQTTELDIIEDTIEETIEYDFDIDLNVSNDLSDQYVEEESEIESTIKSFDDIATFLKYNTSQDPVFHTAMKKFVDAFKKMPYSAIISTLHCFGEDCD